MDRIVSFAGLWHRGKQKGSDSLRRRMRRAPAVSAVFLLTVMILASAGFAHPAFANAPVPMYFFTITVENPPEGSFGVDFLVPEDSIPAEEYTECNEAALTDAGFPADCGLVSVKEDGYVSYMCHDINGYFAGEFMKTGQNAETETEAETGGESGEKDPASLRNVGYDSGYKFLTGGDCPDVRLCVIDRAGEVLAVSAPFEVRKSTAHVYYGDIVFDAASGEARTIIPEKNTGGGPADWIFFILASLAVMAVVALITMIIEFLLAFAFGIRPAGWTLLVNLCSNLSFNFLLLLFSSQRDHPVPYWGFVFVGEIAVVIIEYLVYRSIYGKTISHKRILAYTITANLVSAVFVIFMAAFIASM